jgi:hypothetical protein
MPPRVVETKYGAAMRMLKKKRKPLPLRNEAPLNCVLLRSQLDCEVAPELYAARKKTSKVSRQDRQNEGYCGSTELPVVAPERS